MCTINAILLNRKTNAQDVELLGGLTTVGWQNNNDSEGAYFNCGITITSPNKILYSDYLEALQKSTIIITHQRTATSGKNIKNAQPFESDDLILVHNGILTRYGDKDKSDTAEIFNKLLEAFPKGTRTEKLPEAIQKTFDGETGSYSIIIHHKPSGNSYYFKNDTTTINYTHTRERIIISTRGLDSIYKTKTFKPYKIYCIDKTLNIQKVGKIKKPKTAPVVTYIKKGTPQTTLYGEENFGYLDYIQNFKGYCMICNQYTYVKYQEMLDLDCCKECANNIKRWET